MKTCIADNAEHCIFCCAYIPEGRQVCPVCEKKLSQHMMEEVKIVIEEEKRKGN